MLCTTLSVLVLMIATMPRVVVSGNVESTASRYWPLLVSASGPAFGAWSAGKMAVTEIKDSTLPVATFTTDKPPIPKTPARGPSAENASDETGRVCGTSTGGRIFSFVVLTAHTVPAT